MQNSTVLIFGIMVGVVSMPGGALAKRPQVQPIPLAFRGHWAEVPAQCHLPAGNNITIGAGTIAAWERTSRVTQMRRVDGTVVEVTSSSSDGEERWTSKERFELRGGGKELVRSDASDRVAFIRCPAKAANPRRR